MGNKGKYSKTSLVIILLASLSICIAVTFSLIGWILYFLWWVFTLILLLHLITHLYCLWNVELPDRRILRNIYFSNLMVVLLFLLRPDVDDSNSTYIVILELIGKGISIFREPLERLMNSNLRGLGNAYFIIYIILIAFVLFTDIRLIIFARKQIQ